MLRTQVLSKSLLWCAVGLLAAALAACSGGGSDSTDAAPAGNGAAVDGDAAPSADPASSPETGEAVAPEETPATEEEPAPERYASVHDPEAVYTLDDLTMRGSYLKINFSQLTPEQVNRSIHRFMTEYCTCGCKDDTIDECLVNDPGCGTAVQLANQILREEKAKGS